MSSNGKFPLPGRSVGVRLTSETRTSVNSSMDSNPLFKEDINNVRWQSDFSATTNTFESMTLSRSMRATRCTFPSLCLTGTPPRSFFYETDSYTLARRQKQIDYGKSTVEYKKYVAQVPKDKRTTGSLNTPDKYQKCGRRSWDRQIKVWRINLHSWETLLGSEPSSEQAEKSKNDEPNSSTETKPHS